MKISVIISSARPGNIGTRVAKWAAAEAQKQLADKFENLEVNIVDLASFNLPHFDEAISPRYNPARTPSPDAQSWLDVVKSSDAFIFTTPEYNRAVPSILKNALDNIAFEADKKASLVVSYSIGGTAGLAANMDLRQLLNILGINPVSSVVALATAANVLSEEGVLDDETAANAWGPLSSLSGGLAELAWYSEAFQAQKAK
jgi:NAD(P)H-dependent FMN reductase